MGILRFPYLLVKQLKAYVGKALQSITVDALNFIIFWCNAENYEFKHFII